MARRAFPSAESRCILLKVALDDVRPPIWRRLAVPGSITLDLLHDALNLAMGWEDYHLHEFDFGGRRFTEDPEELDEGEDERGVRIDSLIDRAGAKFAYRYDFGDGWRHTVKVEQIDPVPDGHAVRMTCLGGRRRCPPEDVGGVHGYQEYLAAIGDRRHPEHKAMLRWRGPFDPDDFDVDTVNRELAKLIRWSRPRTR